MTLEQFNAVLAGYGDRLVDSQIVAVLSGYYSGYYTVSKRSKKPTEIIKRITKEHQSSFKQHSRKKGKNKRKDDDLGVKIAEFKERDKRFNLRRLEGE